jgi:ubiquinone/menaquinone biosynthesis C-methylase UbiE
LAAHRGEVADGDPDGRAGDDAGGAQEAADDGAGSAEGPSREGGERGEGGAASRPGGERAKGCDRAGRGKETQDEKSRRRQARGGNAEGIRHPFSPCGTGDPMGVAARPLPNRLVRRYTSRPTELSPMHLRTGIPLLSELDAHLKSDLYNQHVKFNQRFLKTNDAAMESYGKLWAKDTFRLWSRRWEYPFAAQRIIEFASVHQQSAGAQPQGQSPFRVLDAGSGVTYFPYFLCAHIRDAQVTCFDSNPAYHSMFKAIHEAMSDCHVKFLEGMLQKIPLPDNSFDAVCCISVLEHTSNYEEILDEFARVLRPGGLLLLTFDLSLDGKFELPRDIATKLLESLARKFVVPDGVSLTDELRRMDNPELEGILTTDHIKKTDPDLLPWKHPTLKAVHDLVHGHGWTGGFRSKSVYCLDVRNR